MKQLHIVRHSKSSWELTVSDIDRPLTDKGIANSYLMAERFNKQFKTPDLAITSPACRAAHTAIIFARVIGIPDNNLILSNDIYSASTQQLLKLIANTPDHVNSLILFGHNNTFTDISNYFLERKIDNLPTTGIASFEFNITNWKLEKQRPVKSSVDFPKNDKFAI